MFISLFIFLLFLLSINTFHWSGNTLYDLEFEGLNFATEADAWACTNLVSSSTKTTTCGSDTILGGYNIMGPSGNSAYGQFWYRTYEDLPSHNSVTFQITFYPVDSWDGAKDDDHFEITIDSTNFVLWTLQNYDNSGNTDATWSPTNICGASGWNDLPPMTVYLTIAHSADTLTLKLICGLNEPSTNESVGFRDIIIIFSTETPAISTGHCGVTTSGYPLTDSACGCGSGTTMTYASSGLCGPCDSSCATCNGGTSSDCLSCIDGYYLSDGLCLECGSPCGRCSGDADFCISCETDYGLVDSTCYLCENPLILTWDGGVYYCKSPCNDDEIVLWDGSCDSVCASPLVAETVGPYELCIFPCEDETLDYYTWNGSCLSGCPSPLTEVTYLSWSFCEFPCPSDEYLYWNGSCKSECPSPLTAEIQGTSDTRIFCWYSCEVDQYLYWNGSCKSECPSPLTAEIQGDRNFCWYDCELDEYLYWNGSCESSCVFPLSAETQGDRNFCWYDCELDEYLYWNGSCKEACPSPLSSEIQGDRNFCWYDCQPGYYLYWNGSCLSSCPSPLTAEIQDAEKFCWFPCPSDQYLYWNGSCGSDCLSPLSTEIQGTRNFCWYTCPPDQYLYWNGSCLDTCPSPLSAKIQDTRKFCWYTCQPAQYLYWNQSCGNSCPSPLNSEIQGTVKQRNFCWFPCQSGEYLYWNGSCMSTCTLPLKIVNDPQISYCSLPCASPNIYWYKNTSCHSSCNSPYLIIPYSEVLQCISPCKDSEYYYDQEGKCYSTCPSPYEKQFVNGLKICHLDVSVTLAETENLQSKAETIKTQGAYTGSAMKASSAISSSNPASALLAGLSAMLQYIRYMKVNYPPKVQVLFMVSVANPIKLGFDFEIPNYVEERLVDYPLPYVFEKYEINSNFVNNLWDFLTTLALIFFTIFVLFLLNFGTRKCSKINKIISKILQVMKWNMPLAMICGSSGDIFFYSSLQFQSSPLNSTPSIACFIVCILMIVTVVTCFLITLKIVKGFRLHRGNEEFKEKWSDWEILFAEYEEKGLLSLGYMALFILRGMIFNLTIANLYNFPLVQSIIITIANVLMYGYILYFRPLKELLGVVQLFITEGIVNIVTICVLILAIMDKANINGESTRVGIGNVMVFLIQAFNTFALVFMGISLLLFLFFACKTWRRLRAQGIKSPLKMLGMIFFEEEEEKSETTDQTMSSSPPKIRILRKIRRPARKENPVSKDLSGVSHVINLESPDESLADSSMMGRTRNNSRESFVQTTGLLKLQHFRQSISELEMTNSQNQDVNELPDKLFCGLDQKIFEGIRNMDGSVFEKKDPLENVLSADNCLEPSSKKIVRRKVEGS